MFKAIKEFFVGTPKPAAEVPYKIEAPVEPVAVQVAGLTVVEGAGLVEIPAAKPARAKKPAAPKKAPVAAKKPATPKAKKTTTK
jgi:hypothetical protein